MSNACTYVSSKAESDTYNLRARGFQRPGVQILQIKGNQTTNKVGTAHDTYINTYVLDGWHTRQGNPRPTGIGFGIQILRIRLATF